VEATDGIKDMPVGVKSLWRIHDRPYADERTDAAFESHKPFDFTDRRCLTECCNRVTYERGLWPKKRPV
jgi:hypothetical protein